MTLPFLTQRPKLKKILLWIGGSFLFVVLFGFLALPPIVKHFAAKGLGEKLHRPVTIRELSINPLNLSARVAGLRIGERAGTETFISIEELYANVGVASIFKAAPMLREIRVKSPYFKIVRMDGGAYNIDDIVAELLKPSEPTHYSINNILVDGGKVEFEDRPKHINHLVSELHLTIPFISNLPYQTEIFVTPDFSARINGAPLHLKGKIKPFGKNRESSIDVQIAALDLSRYFEYLTLWRDKHLDSAVLDANMEIAFSQPAEKTPEVNISGTASVKNVLLTEAGSKPLARLAQLSLDLQSADIGNKKLLLRSLTLQDPMLHVPGSSLEVQAGEIHAKGGTLTWSGAAPVLSQQEFGINGLRLKDQSEQSPRIEIGTLTLKEAAVDVEKRTATLGAFETANGRIEAKRDRKGAIDLALWFASDKSPAAEKRSADKPWQFALAKLSLGAYAVGFSDDMREDPVHLAAEEIKIDASDVSNQKDRPAKLALDLRINKSGTLAISGTAGMNPLKADLDLDMKTAKLGPFQPYFTDLLTVILTDGSASAKGKVQIEARSEGAPKIAFNGDLTINRLAAVDKEEEEDFLKWNALSLRHINAVSQPLKVDIAEIDLDKFYSRLVVNPDGTLNLQHVLAPAADEKAKPEASKPEASKPETPKPETSPKLAAQGGATPAIAAPNYKISIAKVTLRNGQVDFSDYFIKPNYSANLTGLGGSVTGLSSDASRLAEVGLKGRVDNQGQLDISGKINPLAGNLYLDLLASLQDFELASLAPYSGKYAGYGIQKGKLAFDVKYHIENRKLTAENHLILNQLTFGAKTGSPDATKLPVLLAVALLSDRNGVIDINLPISGSLDDPQFSVGGIIVKVIVNLVVKAVTAPFALIGSMFGGGEELAYLEFDYGKDAIGKEAETKLNSIAKALNDRPALKLDIAGQVDPEKDNEGLKQLELEHKIKAQKLKELLRSSNFSGTVDEITVAPGERARYLAAAYKQEKIANKPRNLVGFAKDIPAAEMEKLILANIQVNEGDLRDLANHRAREAKEYLVNNGKVPADRIFLVAPKDTKNEEVKAKLSRVNFVLGTH